METQHPDPSSKRYLDIGLSDVIGYGFGFLAPPVIIYHVANLPNAAFIVVWMLMLLSSFAVLKLRVKSRICKALAQSVLISCIAILLFVVAVGIVMRQILPPLCC